VSLPAEGTDTAPVATPSTVATVALVHDYLNQRGGAERVALALSDIWPEAPLYTSLFRAGSTFRGFASRNVRTTFLDHAPVDQNFRRLFPLYAPAFRSLPPIDADVVIASSSGWAHMAPVADHSKYIVYCHTPARWLYGSNSLRRASLASPIFPPLRAIDRRAAARADIYVANSSNVREKIRRIYHRDAEIVYPPVDTERFVPTPRGTRLLVISRLLPYKRVDLVIRVAERIGLPLDIVGTGPELDRLRTLSGEHTRFHGAASDEQVTKLVQNCWAVCVPGEEDFGIVAVEAQAAGKPVIAFRAGGSLESVVDGVTGVLFDEPTEGSLTAALEAASVLATPPDVIAFQAQRFSTSAFRHAICGIAGVAATRGAASSE
jgi:glycosyltransferase involved in cell wall biosynthesis